MVSTRTAVGLDRHPGQPPAAARRCSSRPSCGCTAARREIVRFAQGEGYMQVARRPRAGAGRGGASRPTQLDAADLREQAARAPSDALASGRGRAPRSSASPRATSAAGRRSCGSPAGESEARESDPPRPARVRTAPILSSIAGRRTRPRRAPDRLRHLHARGARARPPASSRAGSRRATIDGRASIDHDGLPVLLADVGADRTRPDGRPPRPPRRRPRPRGAVRAARRGRPPDRPRRLRHEGRARGDDVRACSDCAEQDARARALRLRARRGVRGRRRPLDRRARRGAACAATSRSPASRPTCTSASRPRACWRCASRCSGRAGARLDAVARRQRDPQGARRLPPDRDAAVQPRVLRALRPPVDQPRRGSRAATPSTRCPTAARWTSTSATCRARTRARSSRRSARSATSRSCARSCARRRSSRARTRTCARCATRSARSVEGEALSVGRDGASDAISFLEAGIPAVEFGPVGGGHHGPEEWVSLVLAAALPRGARRLRARAARRGSRATARAPADRRRGDRAAGSAPEPRAPQPVRASACRRRAPARRAAPGAVWLALRCSAALRRSSLLTGGRDGDRAACSRSKSSSTTSSSGEHDPRASSNVLDDVDGGEPQTILVLGSDHRYQRQQGRRRALGHDDARAARTRTRARRRCMSIPRDLKVDDPAGGAARRQDQRRLRDRRPEALTRARSITQRCSAHPDQPRRRRQLRRLPRAVNALGCVYVDVDRRYYHNNLGLPAASTTRRSTSSPATRSSAAQTALDYVRFRHIDTDLVRAARQQDFLRQAKAQYGVGKLLGDRNELDEALRHATRRPTSRCSRRRSCASLKLVVYSAEQPDPAGPVPATSDDADGGSVRDRHARPRSPQVRDEFLNARAPKEPPRQRGRRGAEHGGKSQRREAAAERRRGLVERRDDGRGLRDPRSARMRLPVYYPKLLDRRRPVHAPSATRRPLVPARVPHQGPPTASCTAPTGSSSTTGERRPVLRRPGHDLDRPADPRQPVRRHAHDRRPQATSSSTTARACDWSPGARRAASTGSRTRCSETLTNKQMLAIARSLTRLGADARGTAPVR